MNESRELAALKQGLLIWLILGLSVLAAWLVAVWLIYYLLRRYEVLTPAYARACAAASGAVVVGAVVYFRAKIN